jgi:hypothetical protein
LHVLQAEVVECDHAHEDERQWHDLHALLEIVANDGEVVQNGLRTVVPRDLSHVTQNVADDAGQKALEPGSGWMRS